MTAESTTGGRRAWPRRGASPSGSDDQWRAAPGEWTNWARTVSASPRLEAVPADVEALSTAVRDAAEAGLRVRAVGAGHSFTAAAATDGLMLRMDRIDRIERVERRDGGALVTVGAGIRLFQLNQALAGIGLALANLGDINLQSVSGAISTGTHGTGIRLSGLAGMVEAVSVVLPSGEILVADRHTNRDVFEAARLGLGLAGVLATVTLACVPAFTLRADEAPEPLDHVLERLDGPDGLVEANDHFEFYWFPHTRNTLTKRNNRVGDGDPRRPLPALRRWLDDDLLSNRVFELTNRLASRSPRLIPRINAIASRALSARSYTAPSYDVFSSPRRVVFREMEYAVPRAALPHVLAEIESWLARSGERVSFPVEVRFAAADDVWLSTAHQRETAYVAVHQYLRVPYHAYFTAVEAIMGTVDGRPHWGKLHNLDAVRLAELYPRFDDFRAVRARLDPRGVFANTYTDRLFGLH